MLNEIVPKRSSEIMLKHLTFFALFLPIYYSAVNSIYYPQFILVNFFALLFILSVLIHREWKFSYTKESIFIFLLIGGVVGYTVCSLYVNYKYLHWYEDQINTTISLIFFIGLLVLKNDKEIVSSKVIDFLIRTVVVSNLIGIIYYFLGYSAISVENAQVQFIPIDPTYYEKRFNWLYGHKNNYGFMLVLFIALFFVYRKRFRNKKTYFASIGVLFVGLIISHSYTSLFAALLIFAGQFVDYIANKKIKLNWKYLLPAIPIFGVIGGFGLKMMKERNLLTLGSRIPIWKESIKLILQSPYGIGTAYDTFAYPVPGLSFKVYNCHNMFLTFMWRFSIPVGLCYALIYLIIIIYSLKRRFSFLSIGIWMALLIPMCMDSTILTTQLTFFLFVLYCIFFRDDKEKAN